MSKKTRYYGIKKLVTFKKEVWDDVQKFVETRHNVTIPTHDFNFSRFLHSASFNNKRFVDNCSEEQQMLLFMLICRKLGISFIPDSSGWQIVVLEEKADSLVKFMETFAKKKGNVKIDTVYQP